jgi:dTDP-4-dehydrorhamnose 3,5-epimerase
MIFTPLEIPGLFVIDPEPIADQRGLFARTVCVEAFARHGLSAAFVQSSVSYNRAAGTLRGMHYQAAPYAEEKLVRCVAGRMFDVAVDLRRGSPTFGRWAGVELSAVNRRAFYIPKGCAHGFLTLAPDTEILYQMTVPYAPQAARGLLWRDPAVGVVWPVPPAVVHERDESLPGLADATPEPF